MKVSEARTMCEAMLTLWKNTEQEPTIQHWKRFMDRSELFQSVDVQLSEELREEYKCKEKQCYYNCQNIAIEQPDLYEYAEGQATGIIPVAHAFLIERATGKVLDPTWTDLNESGDYFGVRIPQEFIRQRWVETGEATYLIAEYLRCVSVA